MNNPFRHPSGRGLYGIFNDSFPPILDGVTLTVENYARWLNRAGRTPCVVTPWNPVSVPAAYEVMRFFSLPIRSRHPYRYGYPKLDPFIWSRLRNTDFRIVHAHCPFSSGRLAVYVKRKQGVPLVGTFHSKYRQDLEHSFKKMPWCVPIIMKRILDFFNACDEVWIPQAQVEETVREYGYRGPLTVVENGNDYAGAGVGEIEQVKEEARRALGMDGNRLHLLFVGQHIWEKGLGTIVDTLALLKGKVDLHMDFIGTGYAARELQEMIDRKGLSDMATLHGTIHDRKTLGQWYAASHLFLFPSFYDNAPLVVREAAALGTPALVPDGSTAAEVIHDRVNGFTATNDAAHFAEIITRIDRDRHMLHNVALGARNSLARSWEDVVGEVMERYDRIIADRRR